MAFFGGARGGGKSDGVLGKWAIKEAQYGADFNAVMFRRTTVSSEDAIERSKQIYGPLGGSFVGSPQPTWRMPNGGRVSFRYLDRESDADEYQGRNFTDVWVEEAGQYPSPKPIDKMFGALRSAAGTPVQMILTGNPGGPGQGWIRDRFQLFPFPARPKIITATINGATIQAAVIPSRISDNKILLAQDPGYENRLRMVGSQQLVRAWLEGDWSAVEGAFFNEWDESKHVIPWFEPPKDWLRFRSGDWGFAAPFSIGWWAVVQDDFTYQGRTLPRGALVRYREWYGAESPNVGLRMTAKEVAEGIRQREAGEKIEYGVLDPAAFAQSGGPSIAETMLQNQVQWRPADNKRLGNGLGAMGGWDRMRMRLRGENDRPMIYFMDTCEASIRTIPVLQHDKDKAEDLDTTAEDHAADEVRYACMSRPWVPLRQVKEVAKAKPGQVYIGPPDMGPPGRTRF